MSLCTCAYLHYLRCNQKACSPHHQTADQYVPATLSHDTMCPAPNTAATGSPPIFLLGRSLLDIFCMLTRLCRAPKSFSLFCAIRKSRILWYIRIDIYKSISTCDSTTLQPLVRVSGSHRLSFQNVVLSLIPSKSVPASFWRSHS